MGISITDCRCSAPPLPVRRSEGKVAGLGDEHGSASLMLNDTLVRHGSGLLVTASVGMAEVAVVVYYGVAVIGAAIEARAGCCGYRRILLGWVCRLGRRAAGCGASPVMPRRSGRISRAGCSRWIPSSGRSRRRGARLMMRLRRLGWRSGRGCCGLAAGRCGRWWRCSRAGCCWLHEVTCSRRCRERSPSRARGFRAWEEDVGWQRRAWS